MEIRKFDVVGAEVLGVDLSRRDDDAQAGFLHRGLLDNGFLVIRDQHISPDDHIAFSTRFGKLSVHVLEDFRRSPVFPTSGKMERP
jgi:taurine dioxygenase